MEPLLKKAAKLLQKSHFTIAFTGAGISVESGIPPFRGEHGLWNKYNPEVLNLEYYLENQEKCWFVIREIFYDFFADSKPNAAHYVLAKMEEERFLNSIITQNIDNLHQEAGSKNIYEFHGNSQKLICMLTGKSYGVDEVNLNKIPPRSEETGGLLKPDFIFFGEGIPQDAYNNSFDAARNSEVLIIVGTTGEVMPASQVPIIAKQNGAKIIEVNLDPSNYTNNVTDIFLQGKATEIMEKLEIEIFK